MSLDDFFNAKNPTTIAVARMKTLKTVTCEEKEQSLMTALTHLGDKGLNYKTSFATMQTKRRRTRGQKRSSHQDAKNSATPRL